MTLAAFTSRMLLALLLKPATAPLAEVVVWVVLQATWKQVTEALFLISTLWAQCRVRKTLVG